MSDDCKKKKPIIALAVVSALLTALILWIIWGNTALQLNKYTVSSERLPRAFDGCKIAHISDLHNTEIGKNNETLLNMLREAKPDIIAITGDLIDSRKPTLPRHCTLRAKRSKSRPATMSPAITRRGHRNMTL